MVDSKELKKEVLEIHFEEKRGRCFSLFGFRIDGYFRYRYDFVHHEENYTQPH